VFRLVEPAGKMNEKKRVGIDSDLFEGLSQAAGVAYRSMATSSSMSLRPWSGGGIPQ
jgi:hypothetical protein